MMLAVCLLGEHNQWSVIVAGLLIVIRMWVIPIRMSFSNVVADFDRVMLKDANDYYNIMV